MKYFTVIVALILIQATQANQTGHINGTITPTMFYGDRRMEHATKLEISTDFDLPDEVTVKLNYNQLLALTTASLLNGYYCNNMDVCIETARLLLNKTGN